MNHIQYQSFETFLLYEEFQHIPGNKLDINMQPGCILTTNDMHGLLLMAYKLVGNTQMLLTH